VALELGLNIHQYQRYEYGEHRFSNCPMKIGLRICAVLELDHKRSILTSFGRNTVSAIALCEFES